MSDRPTRAEADEEAAWARSHRAPRCTDHPADEECGRCRLTPCPLITLDGCALCGGRGECLVGTEPAPDAPRRLAERLYGTSSFPRVLCESIAQPTGPDVHRVTVYTPADMDAAAALSLGGRTTISRAVTVPRKRCGPMIRDWRRLEAWQRCCVLVTPSTPVEVQHRVGYTEDALVWCDVHQWTRRTMRVRRPSPCPECLRSPK